MLSTKAAILAVVAAAGASAQEINLDNIGDLTSIIPSSILALTTNPASYYAAISSEFATGVPSWVPTDVYSSVLASLTSGGSALPTDINSVVDQILGGGSSTSSGASSTGTEGAASGTGSSNSTATDGPDVDGSASSLSGFVGVGMVGVAGVVALLAL